MIKPTLKRETAITLLEALGYGGAVPIGRTVLVTALDGLTREAKDDLIQFLSARPVCTCGAAREPDYTNGDHDDACPAKTT